MQEQFKDQQNNVANLSKALSEDNTFNQLFGDSLLLYKSILEQDVTFDDVNTIAPEYVDNALSKSYMLAWVAQ